MSHGMWVSASGAMAQLARQDVIANNLANAQTVGFKEDFVPIRQRAVARVEDDLHHLESDELLERLGAGVMPEANSVKFKDGPIKETGNDLDVAIKGEGFLRVRARDGEGFALTRDGRMTVGADGTLVRVADGRPILDRNGAEIALDRTQGVQIDDAGVVSQGGARVAQLGLVAVDDPGVLHKAGSGDFAIRSENPAALLRGARGRVIQGSVEGSAVNMFGALMGVTGAGRAASGALRMVSTFDEINGLAVTRLGRVN